MKIYRYIITVLLFCIFADINAQSFVHEQSKSYIWPEDKQVLEKLKSWQDLKFGILMHWGIYSVPGICESWTICSEDWITPPKDKTYEEYKQWYWGLSKDFNPVKFNPEQWAAAAKDAGMKYFIFTTKHHDGFCMFDSKETDYTVMNSGFKGNPKADVLKYVMEAFRNEGMMAGCYFSKPDWHSPYYWWPAKATADRHHNYNIEQYPERWNNYKQFVYNQIFEITHNYGKVDILWLDGGWCTPPREDIELDRIVNMARAAQSGLIVVDRACPGKHENYQTPEQNIPDHQITTPWESCITLTNAWGWDPNPKFKSPAKIIAILSEIVAKGGNLVLGVGPSNEGLIEDESVKRLHEIGLWLKANGEAIYNTVVTPIYSNKDGNIWFTANKNDKTMYVIIPQKDDTDYPPTVTWEGNTPKKGSKMICLGNKKNVKWKTVGNTTTVFLPKNVKNGIALKFEIK